MDKLFAALGGTTKVVDIIVKLVIAVVIFYFLRDLYIKWKRRNASKAFVDNSALDPSKNYDNIAKQVHDACDNSFIFTSGAEVEEVSKQLLFLTDNELRQVNNRYAELYGKGTRSLQDAISDPICIGCDARGLLLERMQKLNLN